MIKRANPKIKKLKKGEGHLISTIDTKTEKPFNNSLHNKSLVESIIIEDRE